MFCPKCGSILMPKKNSKGKKVMGCSCGYSEKIENNKIISESKKKKEEINFDVVEDKDDHLPLADVECPKCGHNKAYFWTIQTRSSDEPETKFYKCEKCRKIWRDYK